MAIGDATHDVSEAFDPSFFSTVVVIRRTQTLTRGRVGTVEKARSMRAVVTPAPPNDLQRLPDTEWTNKAISIYTQFRLKGNTPTTLPDKILWHGSEYLVAILDDYSQWGRGFLHAVAVSLDAVDPPPTIPDVMGNA